MKSQSQTHLDLSFRCLTKSVRVTLSNNNIARGFFFSVDDRNGSLCLKHYFDNESNAIIQKKTLKRSEYKSFEVIQTRNRPVYASNSSTPEARSKSSESSCPLHIGFKLESRSNQTEDKSGISRKSQKSYQSGKTLVKENSISSLSEKSKSQTKIGIVSCKGGNFP